jgi:hypothetical protein
MSDTTVAQKLADALERVILNFDTPIHVVSRISMLIRDAQDIQFVDGTIVPDDDVRRGTAVVFTSSLVIHVEWHDPTRDRPNLTYLTINAWSRKRLAAVSFTANTKGRINLDIDWKDGPVSGWPWSAQAILHYEAPGKTLTFPLLPGSRDPIRDEIGGFFPALMADLSR